MVTATLKRVNLGVWSLASRGNNLVHVHGNFQHEHRGGAGLVVSLQVPDGTDDVPELHPRIDVHLRFCSENLSRVLHHLVHFQCDLNHRGGGNVLRESAITGDSRCMSSVLGKHDR